MSFKKNEELEIELVVFKKEENPIIAGVQLGKVEQGYKKGQISFSHGGVLIEIPGHKGTLIPFSNIRQIDLKA